MPVTDHLVAAFTLLHLVLISLAGIGPMEVDENAWLAPVATPWNDLRQAVWRGATRRYGDALGPRMDGWLMFKSAATHNTSTHLEVRTGSTWELLYAIEEPGQDWRRARFTYYRWRELLGQLRKHPENRKLRARFVQWLASEVSAERPDACEVRIRVWTASTPKPHALARGEKPRFDDLRNQSRSGRLQACK